MSSRDIIVVLHKMISFIPDEEKEDNFKLKKCYNNCMKPQEIQEIRDQSLKEITFSRTYKQGKIKNV